ncbi:inorganic pyrophosphatase [Lysinibacillus fusiformis ZC1]|nr:inorganic pyrophosphatase [Lysinibacillus fusiformis ZC1]
MELHKLQKLKIIVDRPMGYKDGFDNIYPINYGYVPGIIGGDGEEQDVYILSNKLKGPIDEFTGKLIAIVYRNDDIEEKWVVTSEDENYTKEQIREQINFMEQWFDSKIELLN